MEEIVDKVTVTEIFKYVLKRIFVLLHIKIDLSIYSLYFCLYE